MATVTEATFWNGELTEARKVTGIVVDNPDAEHYWARDLVGQTRNAVVIIYAGETFYIDDQEHRGKGYDGCGWTKVTAGRGAPRWAHRSIHLADVRDRDD